jgi:hypothetical protein
MTVQGKTSRTVGWVLFGTGVLYMVGLGWLYSWWAVPGTREAGPAHIQDLVGFAWALAVPLDQSIATAEPRPAAEISS